MPWLTFSMHLPLLQGMSMSHAEFRRGLRRHIRATQQQQSSSSLPGTQVELAAAGAASGAAAAVGVASPVAREVEQEMPMVVRERGHVD